MAFLIQQVDGGRIPGIEYLPAGAITPKVGMALTQTGGNLAVASGTTTPTYISMVGLSSGLISLIRFFSYSLACFNNSLVVILYSPFRFFLPAFLSP